ncbi:MAG: hypothetical protein NDI61_14340, partial [Bdellovibrionaceae bacterium]|nr:hypothetical protein [Pseudobdellovibrionaceae bacterium]
MSRSPSRLPSRLPRRRPAWLRLLFAQFIGILITTAGVLPGFLLPAASAQIVGSPSEPKPEPLRARLERLESLITPLQEEVLRLKLERSLPSPVTDEYFGHGPSMSKAFFSPTSL